ncbi:excinuclease ABC subunit UvrC [bacterium]|nr:excinuclease ABC subunit UvrC [bacterium]
MPTDPSDKTTQPSVDPTGEPSAQPDEPTLSLEEKLKLLPTEPGVYLFKDKSGKTIYVGKAKVLRNRVRSYFTKGDDGRWQYRDLIARIADLEIIVTANELEALIVEANMIRRHRPRFNMEVRDPGSYPYLKVTKERFPRVFLTRKPRQDGSKYYGPLSNVTEMKDTLRTLRKATRIRTCNLKITPASVKQKKHKVCLEFHIGNCDGPCEGRVSESEYDDGLKLLVNAVHGKQAPLIEMLEERMRDLAQNLKYEQAAKVRDQIQRTKQLTIRQTVLTRELIDRDAFAVAQEDEDGVVAVLRMREGKIIGRHHVNLSRMKAAGRAAVWMRVLSDYYLGEVHEVPSEILIPEALDAEDEELLLTYLEEKRGRKVKILVPQRGEKFRQVHLAGTNAKLLLGERLLAKAKAERIPHSLLMLEEHLKLDHPPLSIECFDNSNLFGQQPVAAMVRFEDGRPAKKEYRHFKIKTVVGSDDFKSMEEVVGRRYRRLLREDREKLPDLVLIDGGRGQVNAARRIVDELGLRDLPVVGLAKRLEEIVFPGTAEPITLPKTSSALKLLMQLRDEAHRFAITYHRSLRNKASVSSTLEGIPGIGETKAKALLRHFGSLKRLKDATPQQIAEVPGFSVKAGEKLLQQLNE